MENIIKASIAIIFTIILGLGVRKALNCMVPSPQCPESFPEKEWEGFIKPVGTGKYIGFFERLLILISFWTKDYAIIAGWLAFKVAAKWEAWSNIIQMPNKVDTIPELTLYQGRKRFGSWLLSRFLLGTLINILISSVGAYIGENSLTFIRWACKVVSNA